MDMTRRDPSQRPTDMAAFRGCTCGCQTEWQKYYPASHPLVLSPEEARQLVEAVDCHGPPITDAGFDAFAELLNRLEAAGKEQADAG